MHAGVVEWGHEANRPRILQVWGGPFHQKKQSNSNVILMRSYDEGGVHGDISAVQVAQALRNKAHHIRYIVFVHRLEQHTIPVNSISFHLHLIKSKLNNKLISLGPRNWDFALV